MDIDYSSVGHWKYPFDAVNGIAEFLTGGHADPPLRNCLHIDIHFTIFTNVDTYLTKESIGNMGLWAFALKSGSGGIASWVWIMEEQQRGLLGTGVIFTLLPKKRKTLLYVMKCHFVAYLGKIFPIWQGKTLPTSILVML